MNLSIHHSTTVGHKRTNNEDSFKVAPTFAVVADGMGGHAGGEHASHIVSEVAHNWLTKAATQKLSCTEVEAKLHELSETIVEAFYSFASTATFPSRDYWGMGSTVVLAYLHNSEVLIAHVGDSRAIIVDASGQGTQLTVDHTEAEELLRDGLLLPGDPRLRQLEHILSRAFLLSLNVRTPLFDSVVLPVVEGDSILLCTDGVTNEVSLEELSSLLLEAKNAGGNAAVAVTDAVLKTPAKDNATAVVITVE